MAIQIFDYESIIKRLLDGWIPNHDIYGEPLHEWWHPAQDIKEPMHPEQFQIVTRLDDIRVRELLNGR